MNMITYHYLIQGMVELSECPSATGLSFDGAYYFSADFNCIETSDPSVCEEYLSDEPLSVTLDTVNLDYSELCDSTLYEIDWNGEITFYSDDSFSSSEDTFVFGDTIYTRISINNDISNYQIFGMSIVQCYVCTSSINDTSSDILSSCLDTSGIVDTSLFYSMPGDTGLEFTNIDSNISDAIEDFSFILPAVADDTFYVDCTVDLEVNNVINNRRARLLMQSSSADVGNRFQSYIASGKVATEIQNTDSGGEEDKSSGVLSESNVLFIGISAGVAIVLLLVIVALLWKHKNALNRQKEKDMKLELQMSTTQTSEANRLGSQTPTGGQSVTSPSTPKMFGDSDVDDGNNSSVGHTGDINNNDGEMDIYGKQFDQVVVE